MYSNDFFLDFRWLSILAAILQLRTMNVAKFKKVAGNQSQARPTKNISGDVWTILDSLQ